MPVVRSTWLSAKSSTASWGKPSSVSRPNLNVICESFNVPGRVVGCPGGATLRLVALHRAFIHGEVDVDGIDRHDRRQHRIASPRVDEVALTQHRAADSPGDRRGDLGIFQIQPWRDDLLFVGLDLGLQRQGVGFGLFNLALAGAAFGRADP